MSALLQDGLRNQAERRPEATALAFRDARLSYGELEQASNRLAHLLIDSGVRHGDRVGLLMPKMPQAIVGMLATLKAGAIYVPLDPGDPEARLVRTLEASDCRCLLGAGAVGGKLRGVPASANLAQRLVIGWLEDEPPAELLPEFAAGDLAAFPATPPARSGSERDVAHILFTSGSTGVPKGVQITHAGVLHFVRWANAHFGTSPDDRISQQPPFRFDLSTYDIFGTLWAGAELHLVPPELGILPHKLAQFIRERRLTQWFSVPSLLNLMASFGAIAQGDFPELRRVLFAGEVLPTPTLIHWMRKLPHVRFTNLYGPTETTISSSYHTVPRCPQDARAPIPIGSACAGEELLILDAQMQPVPAETIGELYIGGVGLSPGYWRDPEKTARAFVQRPGSADPEDRLYRTGDLARRGDDGLIYYLGRADSQIKSRGYRIELGEIEAGLGALPGLRESAVVAIPSSGFEGWLICCAYVPARENGATPESLRSGLAALVPGYMLPARWLRYDELPRNGNGKVDRPVLREAFARGESSVAGAELEWSTT